MTATTTTSAPAGEGPEPAHRVLITHFARGSAGLVVTGLDGATRAGVVRGLRESGRRVLVVATTAEDAATWRHHLDEPEPPAHGVAPGLTGTEDEIAEQLAATAGCDGWLTALLGPPTAGSGATAPLSAGELDDLRRLLDAEHGPRPTLDPARRHQVLPPPVELPPEPHVDQLVGELLDVAGPATSPGREGSRGHIAALACLPPGSASSLEPTLRGVDAAMAALGGAGEDAVWGRGVVDAVLEGRAAAAWSRVAAAVRDLERVTEHDRGAGAAQVRVVAQGTDPGTAAEAFERFAAFLAGGGAVRRVLPAEAQREVEGLLPGLAVDGVDPMSAEGALAVAHHLRLRRIEADVAAALAGLGRTVRPAEQRGALVHRLLALRETGTRIAAALEAVGHLRALLAGLPAAARPPTDGLRAVGRVVGVGRSLCARPSADLARRELGDVVARLQAVAAPAERAPELRAVLTALRQLDVEAYRRAADAVDRAHEEQRDLRRSDALAARLADRPALLAALAADPSDETWEPRARRWAQAWAHRTATAWLAGRPLPQVTTAAVAAGRARAGDAEVVVLGPLRDGEEPPGAWGGWPEQVVDLPGSPDDGRRLLVLPGG